MNIQIKGQRCSTITTQQAALRELTNPNPEMSGFTEPSHPLITVKKEIKEEEFDDFLPEDLSAIQTVDEKPGMEYEIKTEMYTSPTMTSPYVSSPTRDIQRIQCNKRGNTEEKGNKDRCHNRSHHSVRMMKPTGEKPVQCSECGKAFPEMRFLKRHQRSHNREKPHQCSQCGKAFCIMYHLKEHQLIHTGEKPHQCSQCEKAFRRMSNLKEHQKIHTGAKPHQCSQCGKAFSSTCHLKKHQRIHTGEKPHHCSQCGKTFSLLHHLKEHQTLHTGEKPHQCSQCGKAFNFMSSLRRHQKIHTGEKTHQCSQCGKAFSQMFGLKRHQRIHSKMCCPANT